MSNWHVNSAWREFFAVDGGQVFLVDCSEVSTPFLVDTADVLSAPDVETLLPSGLALWPRGAAWGTPDGEAASTGSVIAGLTRALLAPFADLYAKAWKLTLESRSATLVDSLDEWEADFGLPDPCATELQSDEQRRQNLAARVMGIATITPADIVKLAARMGFVVALEEPDAFLAGESTCLSADEVTDTALEQQWVVHLFEAPVSQFEAGIGETGVTLLLDFDFGMLECAIRRIAPGWSYALFSYAPIPSATFRLATEHGALLVTESGLELLAPMIIERSSNPISAAGNFVTGAYQVGGRAVSAAGAFSVARASIGTCFSASGVLTTAAANVARIDHEPATAAAKGLLVEEARTNLLIRSAEFDNAVWSKSNVTVNANATQAPDGDLTADKLVETAIAGQHYLSRSGAGISPGALLTGTVYVKAGERSFVQIGIDNVGADGAYATFDLAAGAVTQSAQRGTGAGLAAEITALPNGWHRLRLTTTVGADATSARLFALLSTSGAAGYAPVYSGDGSSGLHLFGAQLESGSAPSSYIPTTSAAVTRAADTVTLLAAGVNDWTLTYDDGSEQLFQAVSGNLVIARQDIARGLIREYEARQTNFY